jgi:hypothetical protein
MSLIISLRLLFARSTSVRGTLRSVDGKQTRFLVSDLETALGVYPETVLRAEDTLRIDIPLSATELAILAQVCILYLIALSHCSILQTVKKTAS